MCLQVKLFICDWQVPETFLNNLWLSKAWPVGKRKKGNLYNWKNDKQNDFFSTPGILINYGTNMIYSQK